MSDERNTADFIKSLFRVSGLDEPDLEEGEDWVDYSSGRKAVSIIYTARPSSSRQSTCDEANAILCGDEVDDEQNDVSEEGYSRDLSQEYYSCVVELFALSDGDSSHADRKEVEAAQEEEKKPIFQTWCIIA